MTEVLWYGTERRDKAKKQKLSTQKGQTFTAVHFSRLCLIKCPPGTCWNTYIIIHKNRHTIPYRFLVRFEKNLLFSSTAFPC